MGWNHLVIVWPWLEPDVAAEAKVWFWRGHDTSCGGLGKCSCFESWTTLQDANDAHVQQVLRTSSHWPKRFFFLGGEFNLSRTCQSTWRSSQSLVWLALHLDMLAMRCQHSACPWTNGSSGLVVDPYDRKVASSLSLFDADPTVCCCSMRWSNLVGRELEKRQNTQMCGGRCMEYQYCI